MKKGINTFLILFVDGMIAIDKYKYVVHGFEQILLIQFFNKKHSK